MITIFLNTVAVKMTLLTIGRVGTFRITVCFNVLFLTNWRKISFFISPKYDTNEFEFYIQVTVDVGKHLTVIIF